MSDIGHCKHGEFVLADGCPKCIEEKWKAKATIFDHDISKPAPFPIVKVKFINKATGEGQGQDYSYYTEEPLGLGFHVKAPTRNGFAEAVVTVLDIPESAIAAFQDKVRTIPAGSIMVRPAPDNLFPELNEPSQELRSPELNVTMGPRKCDVEHIREYPDCFEDCPKDVCDGIPIEQTEGELAKSWNTQIRDGEKKLAEGLWVNKDETPVIGTPISETSIVQFKVAPEREDVILKLYEEGVRMAEYAESLVIKSNEDLKPATNDLAIIAKLKKELTTKKAEYVNPIRSTLDAVNKTFNEFLEPFLKADFELRTKIKRFHAEAEIRAAEAKRIEDEKLRLAREEAALHQGETTVDLTPVETPPPAPARVRTSMGTQGFRKVYKWEITDKSQIPLEYLEPNAAMITGVVNGSKGKIVIPGIRIWEDTVVTVNTKGK